MTDDGLHRLTCAIIARAVYDYRSALKGHCIQGYRNCEDIKDDCERFFRSSWFHRLAPDIDGEWIIECTKKNVKDWKREYNSKRKKNSPRTVKKTTPSGKVVASTLFALYYDGKRTVVGTADELGEKIGISRDSVYRRARKALNGIKISSDPIVVPANTEYDNEEYTKSVIKPRKTKVCTSPDAQYRLIDNRTLEVIMVGTAKELAEYEHVHVNSIHQRARHFDDYIKFRPSVNLVEKIK